MERILVSDVATRWSAVMGQIERHDCERALAVTAILASTVALTAALAAVVGDIADSEIVQTVAQLLARGLPL